MLWLHKVQASCLDDRRLSSTTAFNPETSISITIVGLHLTLVAFSSTRIQYAPSYHHHFSGGFAESCHAQPDFCGLDYRLQHSLLEYH